MASTIEEIPIESGPIADVDAGAEEAQAPAPPEPAAKKRGRPKGSKNRVKEPPAPRAAEPAPKKRVAAAPPSSESEEELPPPKAKRTKRKPVADSSEDDMPPPQPLDSRAVAAEVLQMLSRRHLDLRQAKREKYRSWFQ